MLLSLSGRDCQNPVQFFSVIPRGVPYPHRNVLQYYVKREKEVNDVIFPSGCEARAINLSNKNVKIGIFTGATSVRSKNIFFTDISRYPTGKHEIKYNTSSLFNTQVELHVHLDGAVRPQTVLDVAKQRGIADTLPHQTVEELNRDVILLGPSSLDRLLQSFSYFMPVIA